MPTIPEMLASYVLRLSATESAGIVPIRSHPVPQGVISLLETIGGIFEAVAKTPASPGYEPWLVAQGWNPLPARIMAGLLVRRGNRIASEAKWYPKVAKALRVLASPDSKKLVKRRRIADLLAARNESTIIDTLFAEAGLDEFEFIHLLEQAAAGSNHDKDRLAELATAVVPNRRGRRVSVASAAHEFLLERLAPALGTQEGYTWSDLEEDYTDPLTQATRCEFREPDFGPRSARRRVRARNRIAG